MQMISLSLANDADEREFNFLPSCSSVAVHCHAWFTHCVDDTDPFLACMGARASGEARQNICFPK